MPKKVPAKLMNRYFVVPPTEPAHPLRELTKGMPRDAIEAWLSTHPDVAAWLKPVFSASTPVALPSGLLTLQRFFDQYPRLDSQFIVLAYAHRGGMEPHLERLWDERDAVQMQAALDQSAPFEWDDCDSRLVRGSRPWKGGFYKEKCYLFGRQLWYLTQQDKSASGEELRLLFLNALDSDRIHFERLRQKFCHTAGARIAERRQPIPEDVRIYVWRRDGGRCVSCGSNERLEYDHIIPVSKGGSSTERNIQLLCEACNRKKGGNISRK